MSRLTEFKQRILEADYENMLQVTQYSSLSGATIVES
jgi:hypothetical protein